MPDQHCWRGGWCWGSCSSGGREAEAQPSLYPCGTQLLWVWGPRHPLAAPNEGVSSAWPDLSDSTNKSAAMRKAEMSRQSFGAWQGSTTTMEQPGIPQGGNIPKGELLSGDTKALWDGDGGPRLGTPQGLFAAVLPTWAKLCSLSQVCCS